MEVAAGEGFDLQSIRDELICPMCISTFQEPRSLHCLHSYCEACLVGLYKANVASDVLFCPECRTKTTLPENGVKGIAMGRFLVSELDAMMGRSLELLLNIEVLVWWMLLQ